MTNSVAALQNTAFTQQNDFRGIVVLEIAFDVASLSTLEMIIKHFSRRTLYHS